MIRRSRAQTKWSRRKRMTLIGLLSWMILLLFGEYNIIHPHAPWPQNALQNGSSTSEPLASPHSLPPSSIPRKHDVNKARASPLLFTPPEFEEALQKYENNLGIVEGLMGNLDQPTTDFTDIIESTGPGVPLPYDSSRVANAKEWEACDQRNAEFTPERDVLCQSYLAELNNMRYIKAMSSRLLYGRTIKFRVRYAHSGIEAIVKVSQRKFYFEATSEYLAFSIDRALNLSRVPTSAFVPLPLNYMKVATAYSPFFSQWINRFIFTYNYTTRNFFPCGFSGVPPDNEFLCAYVTIQLWMHDVHSALSSFLSLPYEYDSAFAAKYYKIGDKLWPPKSSRLRAIGDLLDRFIFDFLIGNTDRGMNDHNNFVYGGCSFKTTCQRPPKAKRILGLAKYAFLDHGSSFYSHREPKGNAFFGEEHLIPICRFRRSTYESLCAYRKRNSSGPHHPLTTQIRQSLSPYIFRVTSISVFEKVQGRLEKILRIVERCLEQYPPSEVFSLPEYWELRIPEEEEEEDEQEMPDSVNSE
ncbi:hypothetical protein BCY84_20502 [Trypanosoma cruzi cruzi]|uniref:FAM20 C-terminal domain-containing protein n=1 Tax=Trypanosoma cruzi TaxID=5693 RepID=A0A2V2VXU0_TRYCR|nr:hypothetical protein BCY84_20502 [Trypanosoma cruzi cruzi]PWV00059.1 hypothetical protein C4B63_7g408 [Trypanosoma cruzi]